MTIAVAGRNNAAAVFAILDVDIGDVAFQHIIRFERILGAFHKVGKVEHGLEIRRNDAVEKRFAASCDVAVNALFVLMQQNNIVLFGVGHHFGKLFHHFVGFCVGFGFVHKETEHTDILGIQHFRDLDRALEFLKMRVKIVGDLDFSDRRTDGGHRNAVLFQLCLKGGDFFVGQLNNVLAVDVARLDMRDAELLKTL